MTIPLRIAFMGTPDFARTALEALLASDHEIICVYSQPPRPKGRGQKTQASPVHMLAQERGIQVLTPLNFKDPADRETFKSHAIDVAIVAAYGLILPQEILDTPTYGCINIHGSLLPRWRGASPIQHAIWKGDHETGIGIMQMERGLDTGPVIAEEKCPITATTNAATLHDDLADMGARMIVKCLDQIAETKTAPSATPQDEALSNYAPMLTKQDGRVDWTQTASQINCQIRGLNPWPGVWTMTGEKRLKIIAASAETETSNAPAGTIINKSGLVACGNGTALLLTQIQPEGKKAMDVNSAINGGYITAGEILV